MDHEYLSLDHGAELCYDMYALQISILPPYTISREPKHRPHRLVNLESGLASDATQSEFLPEASLQNGH